MCNIARCCGKTIQDYKVRGMGLHEDVALDEGTPLSGLVVVGPSMRMVPPTTDIHKRQVVPCKEWKSLNRLVQLQRS